MTEVVIVLNSEEAVKAFSRGGNVTVGGEHSWLLSFAKLTCRWYLRSSWTYRNRRKHRRVARQPGADVLVFALEGLVRRADLGRNDLGGA